MSGVSSASSTVKGKQQPSNNDANKNPDDSAGAAPEGEDTMKNLRKTFAGIFGDIN